MAATYPKRRATHTKSKSKTYLLLKQIFQMTVSKTSRYAITLAIVYLPKLVALNVPEVREILSGTYSFFGYNL